MSVGRARAWHAVTAAVALAALVLQLVLVVRGGRVLDDQVPPGLGIRLGRLASYFTIQSNALVALTSAQLALGPTRDGRWWRGVRVAAVVGIAVTGLVHVTLLRPLLHLHGADRLADTLLHQAVPVLAVAGWAAFGPRPRVAPRDVGLALGWPVAWTVWTLVVGGVTGWYPYPFLDPDGEYGVGGVVVACLGITALFLLLFAGAAYVDRRAPSAPAPP